MLIDWFTVGAQVLNFGVLLWLMKHFLYGPVQGAIAAREKRIADELGQADAAKIQAQRISDEFKSKTAAFDKAHAALLVQASAEAGTERERLLDDARKAADLLSTKRRDALASEAASLDQQLRQRVQREVFALSRAALAALASTELEARACDVFIARLLALDDKAKASLKDALHADGDKALVRSAFDLGAGQQAALTAALATVSASAPTLRFETAPAQIAGIEMDAHGFRLAWSIADYLGGLQHGVSELLSGPGTP